MGSRPHILMLFLDGVGIGRKDSSDPFFHVQLDALGGLLGGAIPSLRNAYLSTRLATLKPINATLGMEGLPQSGTGQTSLLTGINAPRFIGRHFGPYPYSSLKPVLRENNIFRVLSGLQHRVWYANAFPQKYFDHISSRSSHMTAITMSWLFSGFSLNDSESLERGEAISADITNERWSQMGYPTMPVLTPQEAGMRLMNILRGYDFVLFEYWLTDHAGHSRSMQEAVSVLRSLDRFLEGILDVFDHQRMTLILTSDHGNLEDMSVKTHTRNPVPLLCVGANHGAIASRIRNLTHIAPAIIGALS